MFSRIRVFLIGFLCFCFLALAGCGDSEDAWRDVINKCANTDVVNNGDAWTYMGITNTAPIGSVWDVGEKGLDLRFDPSTDFQNSRTADAYIQRGVSASCVGSKSVAWNAKPDLVLGPEASSISGTIKAQLDNATNVSVSVQEFRVDELKDLEYLKSYKQLDQSYYQDLNQKNRYVANLAVWVSGLSVKMDFSDTVAADLHAKFPKGIPLTAGMSAKWSSQTELVIKLTNSSSILAERFVSVRTIIGTAVPALVESGNYVTTQSLHITNTDKGQKVQTLFVPVDLSDKRVVNRKPSFHPKSPHS